MTPEERIGLERRLFRQDYWLRILTAILAGLSLVLIALLVWLSIGIQIANRQILTTLIIAIEQGNKRTPVVIKRLEDEIDARSKAEHDQTQAMLLEICRANHIKCPPGRQR